MKPISLILVLLLAAARLSGQGLLTLSLADPVSESSFNDSLSQNHSSVRNLYFFLPDSIQAPRWPTAPHPYRQWLVDKLFNESTIIIHGPGYFITADPAIDAELGRETVSGKDTWVNTRGVHAYGSIKKPRFEFYTAYFESQAKLPPYLDSISRNVGGVPGQGYFGRADGTIDHGYATGWLHWKANRFFTFEAGTGRNFFGNGYRSMLLSDNARNAPYFRIDTRLWRLHYVNLWTEMQDSRFVDVKGGAFAKKYGAFHYLSYSITKRVEINFFEAVIWQGRDSTHSRGFDINYLNPIILYRPVEWTMGSPDNALMGAGLSWMPLRNTTLYGQFMIDEWSVSHMKAGDGWYANKFGGQVGAKGRINLKKSDELRVSSDAPPVTRHSSLVTPHYLYLQSELNFARPYTFSHYNLKQSYSHLQQPLAHPLGANFWEWVSFADLRWGRWILEGRYSVARFGANYNGLNYGQNILLSYESHVNETGNFIGQGLATNLTYKTVTLAWMMNPANLMNVFVSVTDRHQVTAARDKQDLWITVGIRNSIRNLYYDF